MKIVFKKQNNYSGIYFPNYKRKGKIIKLLIIYEKFLKHFVNNISRNITSL